MHIGIPKEIKDQEYRIGATPAMAMALVEEGHTVTIQRGAAEKIGFPDLAYSAAGCRIVETAAEVYEADMIIKVKEPQPEEFPLMHEGQVIFGFFHLAPDPEQTQALVDQGVIAIAYETITDQHGRLPLLVPMSEIAGRIAIQAGATSLQMIHGGKGVLLGGVPGVPPAKVVVIGGGIVGTEAARMALGLGADVTILDRDLRRLRQLDEMYGPRLKTLYSNPAHIRDSVTTADLVVGAVLIPGKTAPKLITRDLVGEMSPGSVICDVAIDQGGMSETSRPTSHTHPTYDVDGVVHYCVSNMPGAVSRTATLALTHATYQYALRLANEGVEEVLRRDPGIREGLNLYRGKVTNRPVAEDLGYTYHSPEEVLSVNT